MTIDNDPMSTYLKSLASLPVLLVTGVWREAATRTRIRRLLAGVQGVIMAAGNMATEGRSDTALWTLDMVSGRCTCGHQHSFGRGKIFLMIADDGDGGHDRDDHHRSRVFLQLQYYFNYRYTVIRWSMVVGLFKDISNN